METTIPLLAIVESVLSGSVAGLFFLQPVKTVVENNNNNKNINNKKNDDNASRGKRKFAKFFGLGYLQIFVYCSIVPSSKDLA